MRSLRLDSDLDHRIKLAAALEGASISEFIRRAISERVDRLLADRKNDRLPDAIGSIHAGRSFAGETGKRFADLLSERRQSGR